MIQFHSRKHTHATSRANSLPREREITRYSTSSLLYFLRIWLCLFWIYKSVTCVCSLTIIAQSLGCVFRKSLKMLFVMVTSKSMTRTDLLWDSAMNPHLQLFLTTEPRFCSRSPQDVTYILGDRALDSKLVALMSSPLPLCLHAWSSNFVIRPEPRAEMETEARGFLSGTPNTQTSILAPKPFLVPYLIL